MPLGKKCLVLTDEFENTFADGKLEFLPEMTERMNMASESGVLIELGPDAFNTHYDGTDWRGLKPKSGDHVYFEKYAGLLVMGNDEKKYRLMDDNCIGAVYQFHPKTAEGIKLMARWSSHGEWQAVTERNGEYYEPDGRIVVKPIEVRMPTVEELRIHWGPTDADK